MTYEEAIEYFKLIKLSVPKEEDWYFDLAIEALQKQVPMKPKIENKKIEVRPHLTYEITNYNCPNCNGFVARNSGACKCGQRLDWSVNNDIY